MLRVGSSMTGLVEDLLGSIERTVGVLLSESLESEELLLVVDILFVSVDGSQSFDKRVISVDLFLFNCS